MLYAQLKRCQAGTRAEIPPYTGAIHGGEMVVVHLPAKKGTFLARILKVWTHPSDPTPWVRIHLYGRTAPALETFKAYWLDGRKRAYQTKKPTYSECWEDIYASDILYVLQHPLVDDCIDPRDMQDLDHHWNGQLEILMISQDVHREPSISSTTKE